MTFKENCSLWPSNDEQRASLLDLQDYRSRIDPLFRCEAVDLPIEAPV